MPAQPRGPVPSNPWADVSDADPDMDSASITEPLASIFDPIVLAATATVAIALLSGAVARIIELVDQS